MCLYQGPSETCSEMAVSAGLTDDAKQTVLDLHNQYRSRVPVKRVPKWQSVQG